jgi:hypothetical protein
MQERRACPRLSRLKSPNFYGGLSSRSLSRRPSDFIRELSAIRDGNSLPLYKMATLKRADAADGPTTDEGMHFCLARGKMLFAMSD